MGAQRLIQVVQHLHVFRIVEAGGRLLVLRQVLDHLLGLGHAALGERHGLVLLVDDVVAGRLERFALLGLRVAAHRRALLQARDDAVDLVVQLGRLLGRARDDERRTRFVNEDAVHLVDDRELMPALDVVRELELHVVAQVVEAELVVGAVRDVCAVRDLPLGVVQIVLDDADRHAEEAVDLAHPFRVAAREVVVDRDDVDAFAFERVEIGGQRRDQRLALAGLHLGDLAFVEHGAADQLDVEVPHVQHAPAGLAHDGERLGQEIVERLAFGGPLAEFDGLVTKLLVRERLHLRLEPVHLSDDRAQPFQFAFVLSADDFCEKGIQHRGRRDLGIR